MTFVTDLPIIPLIPKKNKTETVTKLTRFFTSCVKRIFLTILSPSKEKEIASIQLRLSIPKTLFLCNTFLVIGTISEISSSLISSTSSYFY